jgi:GntR family transcriptional regulator
VIPYSQTVDKGVCFVLHIQIDPHSGVPVYRQVMDQIKYYVAAGTLRQGDSIPSIRVLAKEMSVNPTTIVKAYSELQHEGVVELKQGKGVFVSGGGPAMSKGEQKKNIGRLARQLIISASQMGADAETIRECLDSELKQMNLE